jgi:hypothetical protein
MRLPRHHIPLDLPEDLTGFKERATRVRSAELAWPLRGGGRSREETKALRARLNRLRAEVRRDPVD